jgi:propanol-preferring alcohol dehydrogenase
MVISASPFVTHLCVAHLQGHEAAGVIVQVGEGVAANRVGERVVMYYYVGCGSCRWCAQKEEQLCPSLKAQLGFVSDGCLAQFLVAPERNAVVIPDSISFEDAAPIGCSVTTAVHAAKLSRAAKGEWAAIYGVNGVGFGLVQLLKHKGLKVIAITRSAERRAKAIELGADVAIDATDPSGVAAAVREATGGEGADVIFECVGRRETMDQCVGWAGALGKRGRLVMVGYTAGEEHEFRLHPIPLIVYEQTVMGSVGATLEDLQESVNLVGSGVIKTLVDSVIPLGDFQLGLDKIKNSACVGKVVCIPPGVSSS